MTRMLRFVGLVVGLAIGLWGCGANEAPGLPPNIVITPPSVPLGTVVSGCSAAELEAWYEIASTVTRSFSAESLAALNRPREDLSDSLGRQSDLLARMLQEPAPECAQDAQAAIIRPLQAILDAFSAYYGQQITHDELRARVEAQHATLNTEVSAHLGDLAAGLDLLFELETSGPTAPPGE